MSEPAAEPRTPSIPPPPRERIAVVVNGNAKSVNDEVISTLDQILMGGDLFVSHRLEDSRDIARTLVDRGYGTVLTGGGDGIGQGPRSWTSKSPTPWKMAGKRGSRGTKRLIPTTISNSTR